MTRKTLVLVLVALLTLAGCSGGGKKDRPAGAASEPTVSTPADETPTPSLTTDFASALEFTKLIYRDKYAKAAELTVPESPAARYVAHQVLVYKAERLTGMEPADGKASFKPDAAAGSIAATWKDDQGKTTSIWRDFTFEQGKLTGWTGKSGPVKDVLWTRTTSDSSRGVKAKLASAYRASSGNLWVTVELSADRPRGFGDAEYAARGGYRQTAAEQNASDLSRGEKTLAYFLFKGAKFGGTLHIPYYDETGSSYGDWELTLKVK
jgi:hypothetical protein